jgi:NADPH:quinone reductase-like Zn-dependent oxidoreductase
MEAHVAAITRPTMKAVQFDRYGDIDVLKVVEVERPKPGAGEVLVRVKAAGINPGEGSIRRGLMRQLWPAHFPSGEGSDLAGVVEEVGKGVTEFAVGDEVLGFSNRRSSQAQLVVVPADQLTQRPSNVPWQVAGALFVAGTTAYAAVRAVAPAPGETVVVAGAAGGVGSLAVQLARLRGAKVVGLASEPHAWWLLAHGVIAVPYGRGVAQRVREAAGGPGDAFIDTVGDGYVDLALELGVSPDRIDTIADFAAAGKYGVKSEGNAAGASVRVLAELVQLVSEGKLDVPIAHAFPLTRVRDAYRELEGRHTLGKIVLVP